MKTIRAMFGFAVCCGVFAVAALAQDAATQNHEVMPADHQAMSAHDHAAMLAQGGSAHNDINGLMDKLNKNLTALGAEKKAGARKELLAAQGAMLKELQGKLQAQGGGMSMGMTGMGKGMMGMGKGMMGNMPGGMMAMGKDAMGKGMECCKGMSAMAGGDMKGMNCGGMMNMDMKTMDMEPKKMDMEPKKMDMEPKK